MTDQIIIDCIRFAHVIGLALGLGLALFADFRFLRALCEPIQKADIRFLQRVHVAVMTALFILWLSGLSLLYVRTGFEPSAFSPKLIAKLLVVTILTVNAIAIAKIAMPLLRAAIGQSIYDIALVYRTALITIGAISAASWMGALMLGIFAAFKLMPGPTIIVAMQMYFAFTLVGAVLFSCFATTIHRWRCTAGA